MGGRGTVPFAREQAVRLNPRGPGKRMSSHPVDVHESPNVTIVLKHLDERVSVKD
jgi:hypothetical protein